MVIIKLGISVLSSIIFGACWWAEVVSMTIGPLCLPVLARLAELITL